MCEEEGAERRMLWHRQRSSESVPRRLLIETMMASRGQKGYAERREGWRDIHRQVMMQVAMLFLTMGEMRHEELWSTWLEQAAELVPSDCMASATCGRPASDRHQLTTAYNSCIARKTGSHPCRQSHHWYLGGLGI